MEFPSSSACLIATWTTLYMSESGSSDHVTVSLLTSPTNSIVFVHGLCPDRRSTWRCNDMFWPDSIAQDMPTARVWLFNYDTSIWTSPSVGKVTQTANDLTLLLDKARVGVSGRGTSPIIWIAHSLGGFVVKQVCKVSST